jgi:hypothetical protein
MPLSAQMIPDQRLLCGKSDPFPEVVPREADFKNPFVS